MVYGFHGMDIDDFIQKLQKEELTKQANYVVRERDENTKEKLLCIPIPINRQENYTKEFDIIFLKAEPLLEYLEKELKK